MKYRDEITFAASKYRLDEALVAAIVSVESAFNPWAWNPEPAYPFLWNVRTNTPFRKLMPIEIIDERPPLDFSAVRGDRDQEWWGQRASWGLMQVMGAVARERGYREPFLTALCDPSTCLDIGCGYFASLLSWANANTEKALAAWNGGKLDNTTPPYRNQAYASRVFTERFILSKESA